jgi:hypothetical protein
VYGQYRIPRLHPNAFKAAEASLCAYDHVVAKAIDEELARTKR